MMKSCWIAIVEYNIIFTVAQYIFTDLIPTHMLHNDEKNYAYGLHKCQNNSQV